LLLWAQQPGDIDRLMHSWWSAAAPQHGMQQQMLRVPHCQLMWEADTLFIAAVDFVAREQLLSAVV